MPCWEGRNDATIHEDILRERVRPSVIPRFIHSTNTTLRQHFPHVRRSDSPVSFVVNGNVLLLLSRDGFGRQSLPIIRRHQRRNFR